MPPGTTPIFISLETLYEYELSFKLKCLLNRAAQQYIVVPIYCTTYYRVQYQYYLL